MTGVDQFTLGGSILFCGIVVAWLIYGTASAIRGIRNGSEATDSAVIATLIWCAVILVILAFILGKLAYWIGTVINLLHIAE